MYFSNKLRAAIEYQRFLNEGNSDVLQSSVQWLEVAVMHWGKVVEVTTPIYDTMPLQHYERNGDIPFHWSLVEDEVQEELKWLKNLALSTQDQMPDSCSSTTLDYDWQPLFNGINLNGWEIKCIEEDKDYEFWKVEDGAIVCNSMDSENHNYVWLQSENEYADFELRLKFQVSRENTGNSGVQFRSRYDEKSIVEGTSAGWLDGPQADIDPNDPWRNGLLYDETRETKRWIYPDLPNWEISKELHSPKKVIFYWEDEETGWNDMTIHCTGMNVKVIVNNVIVTDYDGTGVLDDEIHQKLDVGTKGHIALQLHKNSRNNIRFKDIEIRQIE